jgi:hypothetical protein
MSAKLHDYNADERPPGVHHFCFNCPGCKCTHVIDVPRWTWNSSMDAPTFTPSLLCNPDHPPSRCHSFITDGKIQFLGDSYHSLAGQTVELPDWDGMQI